MIEFLTGRTHKRLRSLLSHYIDGQVRQSEAARIERHLTECEECRAEIDTLRATVGLLRALPEIEMPRAFTLSAVPVPVRFASPFVRATGIATSIAGVLLAGLLLGDVLGLVTQSEFTLPEIRFAAEHGAASRAAPAAPASAPAAAPAPAAPAPAAAPAAPAQAAPIPQPPAPPAPTPAPAKAPAAAAPALAEEAQSGASAEPQAAPTPSPQEVTPVPEPVEEAARSAEVQTSQPVLAARSPVEMPAKSEEQAPGISERPIGPAIPLWQLESLIGGIFILLVVATLWMLRARGRSPG